MHKKFKIAAICEFSNPVNSSILLITSITDGIGQSKIIKDLEQGFIYTIPKRVKFKSFLTQTFKSSIKNSKTI